MSEPDFKIIVESAPDTIIIFGLDGCYKYVSPAIREATAGLLSPEDLVGKHPCEIGHHTDDLLSMMEAAQTRARETGQDQVLPFDYETPVGMRHFQALIRPQRSNQGGEESFLAIVRDVTDMKRLQEELAAAKAKAEEQAEALKASNRALERIYLEVEKRVGERTVALEAEIAVRKQSAERLRESEERYRAIVGDLGEFVCRYSPDGTINFVNEALNRFNGSHSNELLGKNLFDLLPPLVSRGLRQLLATATQERPFVSWSHPMPAPNGEECWQEWVNRALYDETSRIVEFQAVGRDITKQKRAEEALARREQDFRALADNASDPIVRYNRNIERLYVNAPLARLWGKPQSDLIGTRLSYRKELEEMFKDYERAILNVFETGQEQIFTMEQETKKGWLHIQFRLSPEFSQDDRVGSVLAIGRDISDLMKLERELRQAKETAEAASLAKSTFLSNMSHEIRTPLNSIQSVIELLPSLGIGQEASSYVRIAEQSANHLLRLINNLLDLSRIEAGGIELARKPFEPRNLLQAITSPLTVTAAAKGLELSVDVAEEVPVRLAGDELRLGQILMNLLGNAIKYTDTGRIRVSMGRDTACAEEDGRVRLRISVQDTGIGIHQDRREHIFSGLRHFQDQDRPCSESTGLGLHISMQLAERMGGRIWVDSEPGRGSTFFFTVMLEEIEPGTRERAKPTRTPQRATPRPLNILLVEDNLVNQMLTSEILSRKGHEVITASNGQEALDALTAGRFDVVLMDVNMPGMDGVETTRHIREGRAGDPDVPIIATTAFGLDGDRKRFLQAGMDEHISKPFAMDDLERMLASVSARDRQA